MSNLALVQQAGGAITRASMPPGMAITSLQDVVTIGKILAASRFFKDAGTEAQAVAKILRGWELGIPPVASLENIYVIDGKTSLSVHIISAKIAESGRFRNRVLELNGERCRIRFDERVDGTWEEIGISEFTMDDARTAKLLSKNNWQQYPKAMLYSRALAQGARWYCSQVFMGQIYVPDELGAETDETGNAIGSSLEAVVSRNNSERIADLLDELGITDASQRKQTAQQHLDGRKAAELTPEELDAVLGAIRQQFTVTDPAAIAVPVEVVPSASSAPAPVAQVQVGNQSPREAISNLLDQLGIQDTAERQQLVRQQLGRRKVENLNATDLQAVLNGIQQSCQNSAALSA